MDGAVSILPYILIVALTAIPSWKLLGRVGLAPAWTLLCLLPLGFIIVMWMVAYRKWPIAETR